MQDLRPSRSIPFARRPWTAVAPVCRRARRVTQEASPLFSCSGPQLLLTGMMLLAAAGCRHSNMATTAGQKLDFNQDVQPILASNCFSCHGPDPEMRKGELRLDLEESAFRKRPGHPDAIIPGRPD